MCRLQHAKQELPRRLKGINSRAGANRAQSGEYISAASGGKALSGESRQLARELRAPASWEGGACCAKCSSTTLITRYFLRAAAQILTSNVAVERGRPPTQSGDWPESARVARRQLHPEGCD